MYTHCVIGVTGLKSQIKPEATNGETLYYNYYSDTYYYTYKMLNQFNGVVYDIPHIRQEEFDHYVRTLACVSNDEIYSAQQKDFRRKFKRFVVGLDLLSKGEQRAYAEEQKFNSDYWRKRCMAAESLYIYKDINRGSLGLEYIRTVARLEKEWRELYNQEDHSAEIKASIDKIIDS